MSNDTNPHGEASAEVPNPAEFWEDFYLDRGPWTGNANAALVSELNERPLSAGLALDVACGTGGDAIWLASHGWKVTGVDISHAALAQAADAATTAGVGVSIRWQQANLESDFPEGAWDLVTVAYLHSPVALTRERLLRRAAAAVAPLGTLVIIGHQGTPSWSPADGSHSHDLPTIDEVLAGLDLGGWSVVHAGDVSVSRATPGGEIVTRIDSVIRLLRASK
jgi:SAM-dependent methyltransferase